MKDFLKVLAFGLTMVVVVLFCFKAQTRSETTQEPKGTLARTVLGVTFDKDSNIVMADQGIEGHLLKLNERLPENYLEEVLVLPPLCVNYEENAVPEIKKRWEKKPAELFKEHLIKFLGKEEASKGYTLLIARRSSSETRPLVYTWHFTCIRSDKLKP